MNPTVAVIFSSIALVASAFAQTPQPPVPPHPHTSQTVVIKPSGLPLPAELPQRRLPSASAGPAMRGHAIVFDADSKEYNSKPGEAFAPFTFSLTNISDSEIVISNVTTSCGCTVAKLPAQPWHLAAGQSGEINVTVNLAGKMGHVTKQVTVYSSAGIKALLVNVNIPAPAPHLAENVRGDRNRNMELAKADRQAVFKGDCRSCHVEKGWGKMGKELYAADCGICHDSPIRAAMVPDLRAPKGPRNRDYWANWIAYGRPGSMMPAFGEKDGGPLSQAQIDSLVTYLMENFPQGINSFKPAQTPPTPSASTTPKPKGS